MQINLLLITIFLIDTGVISGRKSFLHRSIILADNRAEGVENPNLIKFNNKTEELDLHENNSSLLIEEHKVAPNSPLNYPLLHSLEQKWKKLATTMTTISATTALTLKLAAYFFMLYFFTVVYNISNKRLLNHFPYPATVSAVQVFSGIPMFLPIWALKAPKNIWNIDRVKYTHAAACHAFGQLATVFALSSGSVSFTHVVKAAEPLFSAGLSAIVMKSKLSIEAYLCLLPIVAGVAVASVREMSFSWMALGAAMSSNFFYQLRMVLSKQSLSEGESTKLSAGNAFRIVTLLAFLLLLPFALLLEGNQIVRAVINIIRSDFRAQFLQDLIISGASFYLYNEISFWILELVHPVSFAVGNTIKRVVLIGSAILFFKAPIDPIGALGALVAILGSFLYALESQRHSNR